MSGKLEGKVAWVSGATMGIGEGIARLYAAEGAKVAMIGRSVDKGKELEQEIKADGGEAFFCRCDVSSEEDIKNSIEETVRRYGTINILINNAGIVDIKALHEYTVEDWNRVMDINVRSIFLAFKYAFPYLSSNERSYVVNLGSISSFVGQDSTPVYTTSKGAVLNLSKSIGLDYARYGIRCNCVCPGITETPMLMTHLNAENNPEEHYKERLRRVPMNKTLYPEDIAKTCLFFSCEDSAGVTATSLIIDGGYLGCAEWDAGKYD
jgi:NAD(P)-dependent dehydrogenase (short-subunit alcohol dehydrogenase family)